ncbi:MAG: hypothetical protein FWH12_01410 [Treponema sp.]|nr:hypothetical protein [Treponema sp.]
MDTARDQAVGLPKRGLRPADLLIIILCLSSAAYSLYLFRQDLQAAVYAQNVEPLGSITIRQNIVQRRLADRLLWGRMAVHSPVYQGDLIRVAEASAATLHINENNIDLNENTLIRIYRESDDEGDIRIELSDGSLSMVTGEAGTQIILQMMDLEIEGGAGSVLELSAGSNGTVLSLSEGTMRIQASGQEQQRHITSPALIAVDGQGQEHSPPGAVMSQPRPNARFLHHPSQGSVFRVPFVWTRFNIDAALALRLEIAADRNFTRIIHTIDDVYTNAEAALGTGTWYWRLQGSGAILAQGQLSIVDGDPPSLLVPVQGSRYRYGRELPQLRFQWEEVPGASSYRFEASQVNDFSNPRYRSEGALPYVVQEALSDGPWYWRVMPVFPEVFIGRSFFSEPSLFYIEQGQEGELVIYLPDQEDDAGGPVVSIEEDPLLARPLLRFPAPRQTIGIEELRQQRSLTFSWQGVPGADAYLFRVLKEDFFHPLGFSTTSLVIEEPPLTGTSWTLEDIRTLGQGNFVWTLEAVNLDGEGEIIRRGHEGWVFFTIEIPRPGPVIPLEPGVLYGN